VLDGFFSPSSSKKRRSSSRVSRTSRSSDVNVSYDNRKRTGPVGFGSGFVGPVFVEERVFPYNILRSICFKDFQSKSLVGQIYKRGL
jgi:hypothetical protein